MRAAQLESNVVVNVIEVDNLDVFPNLIDGTGANIGDTWDGAKFVPPAPTPAPVPKVISPRQFRQSLTHFAYRTAIESAIGAADQDTKDWYQYATEFQRHHPVVLLMAQSLGYTSDQLDQVWTYAATL